MRQTEPIAPSWVWDWIHSHDKLVREIRRRREQDGVGYLRLAEETGLPLSTIRDYCTYRTKSLADRFPQEFRAAGLAQVETA